MSEHSATVTWRRTSESFGYDAYNRDHTWSFDGGVQVRASAAPAYRGDLDCVDPEEALVAAISGCHMLTFLAIASRKRLVVDAYEDHATGFLEKNASGKLAVTRVVLRPLVQFGGTMTPSHDDVVRLHEQAHDGCIIANSVLTTVTIEPVD